MSEKAKILNKMYKMGRISRSGIVKAAADGVITEEEAKLILGE